MINDQVFIAVVIMSAISIAVPTAINSLLLFGVLNIFKEKKNRYGKALKAAAIATLAAFLAGQLLTGLAIKLDNPAAVPITLFGVIPIISLAVNTAIVRHFYKLKPKRSLAIAAVWTIPGWVLNSFVTGMIIVALINAGLGSTTITITG